MQVKDKNRLANRLRYCFLRVDQWFYGWLSGFMIEFEVFHVTRCDIWLHSQGHHSSGERWYDENAKKIALNFFWWWNIEFHCHSHLISSTVSQHVNDSGDILMINFISCLNFLCKLDVNLFSLAYSLQATLCARGRMKLEKIRKEIRTFEKLTKLSKGIRWISRQKKKKFVSLMEFFISCSNFSICCTAKEAERHRIVVIFYCSRLPDFPDWLISSAYIFLPLFACIATSSLLEHSRSESSKSHSFVIVRKVSWVSLVKK